VAAEVPLVSGAEAADYAAIDNFSPGPRPDTVAVTIDVRRHTYALRVQGDSMVSDSGDSFPEGSIVIVEPEMAAVPGDYVIALAAPGVTIFRKLVKDGGDLYLKPLSSRHPIEPLGSAKIIGVVREFKNRFR